MKQRPLPRTALAALLSLSLTLTASAPAGAGEIGVQGGLSLIGYAPIGDAMRATFNLGGGLGAEVGLVYSRHLRLIIAIGGVHLRGTPPSGPLADLAVSRLWSVPLTATVEYTAPWPSRLRPYAGAGLGVTYMHERVTFASRHGEREAKASVTEPGWQVLLGVEQNRAQALFAEAWFCSAATGGVEDVDGTSRSLANVQLRVGLRSRFR